MNLHEITRHNFSERLLFPFSFRKKEHWENIMKIYPDSHVCKNRVCLVSVVNSVSNLIAKIQQAFSTK